jgi:hypothetical protein
MNGRGGGGGGEWEEEGGSQEWGFLMACERDWGSLARSFPNLPIFRNLI